jgi:hypothetical protein
MILGSGQTPPPYKGKRYGPAWKRPCDVYKLDFNTSPPTYSKLIDWDGELRLEPDHCWFCKWSHDESVKAGIAYEHDEDGNRKE